MISMYWKHIAAIFISAAFSISPVNSSVYGPYNLLFGDVNQDMHVSWVVKTPVTSNDKSDGLIYITMTLAAEFSWMAFGFALGRLDELPEPGDEDPLPMDLVVVWIDTKGRVHMKDCVSTTPLLAVDPSQDYHHVGHHTTESGGLNITFYRLVDTKDGADRPLQRGKISLVYGYGSSHSFRDIKEDVMQHRKVTEAVIIPDSYFDSKLDNDNLRKEFANQPSESSTNKLVTATPIVTQSSEVTASEDLVRTRLVYVTVKQNCTDQNSKTWYEALQVRESSIYYAIIGTAALLTGIIVLLIACCCARKASVLARDPMKAKVAFYKVDDYEDDEHVEFLKERS